VQSTGNFDVKKLSLKGSFIFHQSIVASDSINDPFRIENMDCILPSASHWAG